MLSQPPNQSPQPLVQDQFSNWLEVLSFLFKTKQGRRIIGLLLGFLGVVTLILGIVTYKALQLMRPQKIEITTGVGTLSIKRGNTQSAVFLLSPNGGDENTPWVKTGIKVKKDDLIRITASGRVHPSQKRLIGAALKSTTIELTHIPWVSPKGLSDKQGFPYQESRSKAKLLFNENNDDNDYGYGMLLATIKDNKGQIFKDHIQPIGEKGDFKAKNDGELVLTVNDIWLDGDDKDVYLLPFEENLEYYINEAKFEAVLRDEDFNTWCNKAKFEAVSQNEDFNTDFDTWCKHTKRKKADEIYKSRKKTWNTIRKEKNWNYFYEDNLGAFSVSIAVNPK